MRLNRKQRIAIHTVSWILYVSLPLMVFSQRMSLTNALIVSVFVGLLHIFIFYTNYFYLVPRFYLKKRWLIYYLSITLSLLFIAVSWWFFSRYFLEFDQFNPKRGFPSPPPDIGKGRLAVFRVMPVALMSVVVLLISSVLRVSQHARLKEKEADLLRAENYDAELKFLKSQINPHFLFNALNNIYSLSITKSKKTPEMLLKLSNMLRYLTYECHADKVPLQKEIEYMEDYIELQKLKDGGMNNITFNYSSSDWQISPMLLIPFVENAFKHSKVEDLKHGWIKIDLTCSSKGVLEFRSENSLLSGPHQKDETGGIGINNVKKRLELLYPDSHEMALTEDTDLNKYSVNLKILLN